jgi:hypothetical protein
MSYLIPVVLVLLLVTAFVTWLVLNAARKSSSNPNEPASQGGEGSGPPGIGPDATPLGDTAEHAGEQTREGTTVGGQDAERSGGTGRPASGYERTGRIGEDGREARAQDAGRAEAGGKSGAGSREGGEGREEPDTRPESERLADRPA